MGGSGGEPDGIDGVGGTGGATGDAAAADRLAASVPEGGSAVDTEPADASQNIATMRIDPVDSVLVVERGQIATVSFRAFATMQVGGAELELTARTVFHVSDDYLVGNFPADGSSLFSTRLPTISTDPPQRGGVVTIQAQAAGTDQTITTVTTRLTVKIIDTGAAVPGSPGATPAIPSDPGSAFTGIDSATLAPTLVYPNDGVLLPPNMRQLEVHFLPGSQAGELYEISLLSDFSEYRYYTRCYADPTKFLAGACAFEIDPDTVDVIAESNRGTGPVMLALRGTDEAGDVGKSASIGVQFAADRVDGAVYYWTTSDPAPRIMRFDFASQSALAVAIQPSDLPSDSGTPNANTRCVGCHALSRDGRRMVASTGTPGEDNLVYISDLSRPKTATDWLTVDGRGTGVASQNKVMTASFNPDGTNSSPTDPRATPPWGPPSWPSTMASRACSKARWMWASP
jgi:hypothetical protein